MKINLIFFLSEFNLGGAGNSVFKLCKNLSKNQFIISVICLNKCFYKEELNKSGIQVFEVKSRKTIFAMTEIKRIVKKLIFNKYKKNIFISNIYYSNILSILFLRSLKMKIVLVERTPFKELSIYYNFVDLIKKIIIKILIKFTFLKADMCVSNSKLISKDYNKYYNLNFKTIYPPSFNKSVQFNNKNINKKKTICIGTVCRLSREKGLFEFFRIIPELKEKILFKIIGDGAEKNKLIKLSKNLKINKQIKFLGFKKPSEIKSAMKKFDIYLNCSHFEGFPNTAVEALSIGKPVIASQSYGGINEIINKKNYGLIYKNNGELINILNKIIEKKIRFNIKKKEIYSHLSSFNEYNNLKKYTKLFEEI